MRLLTCLHARLTYNNAHSGTVHWNIVNDMKLVCLLQGEKNNGYFVLAHNLKQGQTSVKDLTDCIRELWVLFLLSSAD
jgi:hypothetical protein